MGRRLGKFDLGILGIQNLIPIAAFHGIFEYSSNNIRIFEPKIFEYSYSVHLMITNIFVFVFGPEFDPEYIRIRFKKNIPNIFVFIFGPKKNICYALFYAIYCFFDSRFSRNLNSLSDLDNLSILSPSSNSRYSSDLGLLKLFQ